MSRILVDQIRSNSASADAMTLDGSGNVTFPANATCSGTATGFGGGKVLQVVSATYSTQVNSSSSSQVDTGLTCSITTTSASSKVYVAVSQSLYVKNASGTTAFLDWDLVRGSTIISDGSRIGMYALNVGFIINLQMASFVFLDSPGSAATHTYKTTAAASSGEWRAQDDSMPSHMVLMEIEA